VHRQISGRTDVLTGWNVEAGRRPGVGGAPDARRKRVRFRIVLAVIMALGLLAVGGSIGGQTSGAQSTTAYGMSVPSLLGEPLSQQQATLARMSSAGIKWVRVEANWGWIQRSGATSFDWSDLDVTVAAIKAAGLNTDLVIDYAPAWARIASAADNAYAQPASPTDYATFAGLVAARYAPQGITTYEIWNEPNLQAFWEPSPDPVFYTSMLTDAYAAIKAVAPGATVLSGGLAPAATDGININAIDYLTTMYASGAAGSFDGLGYHAYSYPALPNTYESWSGWSQMNQTSPSLRSVMTANGDSGKQIWITEIGAPSAGTDGIGTTGQANEVSQSIADAKASTWIGGLFFYNYQDATTGTDYFGLIAANGTAKPAWTALATGLGGTTTTTTTRPPTTTTTRPPTTTTTRPPTTTTTTRPRRHH
jgi:hypothetical protein